MKFSPAWRKKAIFSILALALLCSAQEVLFGQGRAIRQGNAAPDFSVKMTDGKTRSLSSLRGKPVMLHFWATWCPPCVRELPMIAQAAKSYSRQLEVFAISVGEPLATVTAYLARQGGTLTSFVSGYDETGQTALLYGMTAIPMTIFIDKAGIITSVHLGAFDSNSLEAAIKSALGT